MDSTEEGKGRGVMAVEERGAEGGAQWLSVFQHTCAACTACASSCIRVNHTYACTQACTTSLHTCPSTFVVQPR